MGSNRHPGSSHCLDFSVGHHNYNICNNVIGGRRKVVEVGLTLVFFTSLLCFFATFPPVIVWAIAALCSFCPFSYVLARYCCVMSKCHSHRNCYTENCMTLPRALKIHQCLQCSCEE